jgi:hypothetical protein
LRQAVEDVYIRASDGLGHPPRRRISLQCQLGNLHWQDFHLLDHQLASLHYPGALTSPVHSLTAERGF